MYQKLIGTSSPGLFIILVDQSGSMEERYGSTTKAEFAAPHPTPVFHSLHRHGGQVRSLAVALWNFTRCRSIGDLIPLEGVLAQAGAVHAKPAVAEKTAFDRKLADLQSGGGPSPRDLFDDTAFTRPVPVAAPRAAGRPAATAALPAETFQGKVERMAPARPVARPQAPPPLPRAAPAWLTRTAKRWAAALVAGLVVLVGAWRGLRPGHGDQAGQPASQAGARDERAAPLAGTSAAELAAAKVGDRRAADLGGGVKLALCGIPAGSFTMGGTGAEETPHEVTLTKSFWLGRTEVTQAQWEAVMGNSPSGIKGEELPVETVSWDDASEFCKKLNAKGLLPAGWRWTLPTEAQWEYACRGGTAGEYAGDLAEMAWYDSNADGRTHPVGTKKPNAYGLFDMHGNVLEWCADWYEKHPSGAVTDPTGPNNGSYRVIRGGSWNYDGSICRSASRSRSTPDYRRDYIGFRVAAVPAERGLAGAAATGPASGAGARDERPAPPPPVATTVEVAGAKAGERREADLGGGVKLELCGIPAGTFTMGGTGAEETPHEVTLTKSFWLGRTEVTQAQWEAVMGNSPSGIKGEELPVETVSWNDATEFCGKLNAKGLLPTGWKWALPTEAQWEYACRAGTTGDYAGKLPEMAWFSENSGRKTHPVGTKKANAWGLHDMHGNVWEWCADWYGDYPKGAVTDPTGSNNGSYRVYRGGSWRSVGTRCRSAYRSGGPPDDRSSSIGCRVAAVPGGS